MVDEGFIKLPQEEPKIGRGCIICGETIILISQSDPKFICDDCLKDLREIIKERRLEKEKAEFKLKVKKRCAELEGRYFR